MKLKLNMMKTIFIECSEKFVFTKVGIFFLLKVKVRKDLEVDTKVKENHNIHIYVGETDPSSVI